MSVINIIRQTRAIHLVTDGLAVDPTGEKPNANVSKLVPLPSLNAAIAARGHGLAPHFFAGAINCRCTSRSELECNAVDAVREVSDAIPHLRSFDLVIAGWDDDGMFNYGISSNEIFGPAWTIRPLPTDNTITPLPFEGEWMPEFRKIVPPRSNADKMDIDHVAGELVELQRRMQPGGLECIGGLVSLTTITKRGIQARIVKRFPEHLNRSAA